MARNAVMGDNIRGSTKNSARRIDGAARLFGHL